MGGDVKMKGKIDGWVDGQDIYMVGSIYGWKDRCIGWRWLSGQMVGWINESINEWMK